MMARFSISISSWIVFSYYAKKKSYILLLLGSATLTPKWDINYFSYSIG